MILKVRMVWSDSQEKSYGLFRILKLILCLSAFIFPWLYIKHFSDKRSYIFRKIVIDFSVVFKLSLAIFIVQSEYVAAHPSFFVIITVYYMSETVLYLLNLILLTDVYEAPDDSGRSIMFVIFNYIEITIDFAILYKLCSLIGKVGSIDSQAKISTFEAVYYSFVTSTTAGFGDYIPKSTGYGQIVVIVHLCVVWLFIILFMNHFISILNERRHKENKLV